MEELKVIENDLVPVYETDKGEKVVYGTELHAVLEVATPYRTWAARRFSDCDATENEDYTSEQISTVAGGTPKKDHIIKLDIAKEMAMLERNEKGKQVRRYFIQVEKKYKEVQRIAADKIEKVLDFLEQQAETNRAQAEFNKAMMEFMQKSAAGKSNAQPLADAANPFDPGKADISGRMKKLNRLIDKTSDLCNLDRNKTLHYLYLTVQEKAHVNLKSYLDVLQSEMEDDGLCNLHVICKVDRLYDMAVEMNEDVIERKRIYG